MNRYALRMRRILRISRWWLRRVRRDPIGAWHWPPWQDRLPIAARLRGRRSATWNDATERAHASARRTSPPATAGRAAPPIDVICATNRPEFLSTLRECFLAQQGEHRRLIVVVNGEVLDPVDVERALDGTDATILASPASSLGESLNAALSASDAPYAAKWDDDDWYGPWYLADAARDLTATGAAVVGKHSYFAYLERTDRTILRFPGHDHRFTSFVAGGTIVLDREQTAGVRFADVSIGEDGRFLRSCESSGGLVYAGSRFGYVQRRGSHNTWTIADERFATGAIAVGDGLRTDRALQ